MNHRYAVIGHTDGGEVCIDHITAHCPDQALELAVMIRDPRQLGCYSAAVAVSVPRYQRQPDFSTYQGKARIIDAGDVQYPAEETDDAQAIA